MIVTMDVHVLRERSTRIRRKKI